MEALRYIRKIETGTLVLEGIEPFIGQDAEIIIIPMEVSPPRKNNPVSARGLLQKYANPELISREASAWDQAMKGKHGMG